MIKATHFGEIPLGSIVMPCFVLEDETRIITDSGLVNSFGIKRKENISSGRLIVGVFDDMKANSLLSKGYSKAIRNPIKFEFRGTIYRGYSAETFTELLNLFSQAGRWGFAKTDAQKKYIRIVEIFRDALVITGLSALIDEYTGYQYVRSERALAEILEKYIAKKVRPWVKTFPLEFYKEIFRLKGWAWQDLPDNKKPHTPSVVGRYTRDIIYKRIIPGFPRELLAKLDELNPKMPSGNRKRHHHSWFDEDEGLPELKMHLSNVVAIMRGSRNWDEFIRILQRSYPMTGDQLELFDDD